MTKALFKKQMMEVFSWLYKNQKTGKNRTKKGILVFGLFYLAIFAMLGIFFYYMADMLCEPLVSADLGWLYFAIMSLIAIALGVFGSVFNTFSSLYQAKDNDLLLSLPIPASKILAIRLMGVYTMGVMYEFIVMIPTLIAWFLFGRYSALGIVFSLLIPLVLSVLILTLSCILGWVVALISSRVKNKNVITVILSLIFIAGYYYIYARAYTMLQSILVNLDKVSGSVKMFLYPLYHMGLAAEGEILSMIIFTAIVGVFFAVIYTVLSKSLIRIVTVNRGTAKVKYRAKTVKMRSVSGALLYKEFKRFTGSASYMLNCGLGIVIMIVAAAALVIQRDVVMEVFQLMFGAMDGLIPMMAAAAICMMITMNDMTAPSISLEGKSIGIIQSLPVSAWQILMAKLHLQLILTIIPAMILTVCAEFVIKASGIYILLIPAVVLLFILFMALLGLCVNLKMPNLNWTSEVVPIKQSMGVMLVLFGGWAIVLALGGLYLLVIQWVKPAVYLACTAVLLAGVSTLMIRWIKIKGTKIFETL
ncbi:MAG: hypothetical protein UHW97_04360 [Frisingicoccus sp.]|nr:hypothetical protein [Frisingicoccus sp.]